EKVVLFRELQHRVANSLQIVASVLMQNARKVQSNETRAHLSDAHNRVMSIAALQKQLAASGEDTVALRPYFTQLCETIGASMIRDPRQIHLDVTGDDSRVKSDISVSLGLVVTELVINALKHAFPDDRYGKVAVDYRSTGPEWALTVADDGAGMEPEAGLGTSIVNALAKHLQAEVVVTHNSPGTTVSLIHAPADSDGIEAQLEVAV
ncbi:MAG TPA: sensor histidine kinase, partial [Sphingomonadaceae bacterium]|nr:sensor histidine kinase [Sphingomonadaceae bacterium]